MQALVKFFSTRDNQSFKSGTFKADTHPSLVKNLEIIIDTCPPFFSSQRQFT